MNPHLIRDKSDRYAHEIYKLSNNLPGSEVYGITSQLRRAALSVPLNVIEGYARQSRKSQGQFLLIAYGSLKESQYLVNFAIEESMVSKNKANKTLQLGEELAKLLWTKSQTLRKT